MLMVRWKRKNAGLSSPTDPWTFYRPLARTWKEAGTMVTEVGEKHDPVMVMVIPEKEMRAGSKVKKHK